MKLNCTCTYCGYEWTDEISQWMLNSGIKCPHCGDKDIKTKDALKTTSDVYGYRFSPPFSKKEDDDEPWKNWSD